MAVLRLTDRLQGSLAAHVWHEDIGQLNGAVGLLERLEDRDDDSW